MKIKKIDNPYSILGGDIHAQSTDVEIKARYREVCFLIHPDRPGGDHEKFIVLVNAYRQIQTVDSRAALAKRFAFMQRACSICHGAGAVNGPYVRGHGSTKECCHSCFGCGYK